MAVDDDMRIVSLHAPLREVPALQKPGQPRVIRKFKLFEAGDGGMGTRQDVRLYLDTRALEGLLAQARSSPTGRVVIHGTELEVEEREPEHGGARFLVMRFTGAAVPEWTGAESTVLAGR